MSGKAKKNTKEGLGIRYHITKANGDPVDDNALYFVLRLDKRDPHGDAARKAFITYAEEIDHYNPNLAADIRREHAWLVELNQRKGDKEL
jgi:nitrogen fixation protein FixH